MTTQNLLVELFTEELPPKALQKLGEAFAGRLLEQLRAQGLAAEGAQATPYATPRRLAAHITQVKARADDQPRRIKLMPVSVGLTADGQPTPALLKKLHAVGADAAAVPRLQRAPDGKAEALFLDSVAPGASLQAGLQAALHEAIAKLPIPKVMTYQLQSGTPLPGWDSVQFVRPAHGLLALHGADVAPVTALGLTAGRLTHGHRFEAQADPIEIAHADDYARALREQGAVIASFAERRADIAAQLQAAAAQAGQQLGEKLNPIQDEALLDEVTALVERPKVLICQFEPEFLQVPQECLILTMKANQKYFPLLDGAGRLANRFLVVSNISPQDASAVIGGNERVVRPRLADAQFFFDQDRRETLASRLPQLAQVVYHARLGTQAERSERIRRLAAALAPATGAPVADAERAAQLAKTDLLTGMVGEFPELQGTMGRYYARHDGESEAVADAIAEHYQPRFAGDALPASPTGLALALADKLETLAGIWGIGQRPTGDKDPFALRRHALGVVRILIEGKLTLSLPALLEQAFSVFDKLPAPAAADTEPSDKAAATGKKGRKEAAPQPFTADVPGLSAFVADRLRSYLRDRGFAGTDIEAVLSTGLDRLDLLEARLAALAAFRRLPAFESLTAANKRIGNILRKSAGEGAADDKASVDPALLKEAAERDLNDALVKLQPQVQGHLQQQDFTAALQALAALQAPVDAFFEQVMVNAEDPALRRNRLALLGGLHALMNQVADLSQL